MVFGLFFLFDLSAVEIGWVMGIGIFFQHYIHSSVKVPHPIFEWVFVTPEMHHPHHSASAARNKNFGTAFSFWDRIFGTYLDPKDFDPETPMGLNEEIKPARMLIGI